MIPLGKAITGLAGRCFLFAFCIAVFVPFAGILVICVLLLSVSILPFFPACSEPPES